MGQHKHNHTAIAAKKGEIRPKKRVTKSQQKRACEVALNKLGIFKVLPHTFGGDYNE